MLSQFTAKTVIFFFFHPVRLEEVKLVERESDLEFERRGRKADMLI